MAQKPTGKNEGWGFAIHRSFVAYAAVAIKVRLEGDKLTVVDAIALMDAGTVVNPDRVAAQMEGAVMFGLSLALFGEIDFDQGAVTQSNFHDYPLLRLPHCPPITTEIIASRAVPGGVGEPGVPPVAPALANAIVAAGGVRYRELPLSKHLKI